MIERFDFEPIPGGMRKTRNSDNGEYVYFKDVKRVIEVLLELERQHYLWGEQNHNPELYSNILMEEVGEVAQAIVQTMIPGPGERKTWDDVMQELIEVAAVATSMRESIMRNQFGS